MKKKIGAIMLANVLACTVALSLAGCGPTGPEGGTGGGDRGDLANVELSKSGGFVMPEGGFDVNTPVEIVFNHTMGKTLQEKLQYQLQEFNKLFPNITVTETKSGNYDTVHETVSKQIVAGTQPNIVYCYGDHVADYNVSESVQALNDFLPGGTYADMKITLQNGEEYNLGLTEAERDMFIEGFYNEGHMFGDGSLMYMLPFAKSTEVMYYNETFFKENKLSVPKTWKEMWETCAKIKEIDPECVPLGYDSEANWFITLCEQYGSAYTYPTGTAENRFRFDNETNRGFVQEIYEQYKKGYFTTQELNGNTYTSNLFTSLQEPKCYMCIGSTAGGQYQKPPMVGEDYLFTAGVATIPQVDPEHPKAISQGPSVCIFKDSNPQEFLASWLLVKYLTTNIEFQADFSIDSGYMPPLKMEYMETLETYKTLLDKADGTSNLAALAAKACFAQKDAYFTSPAFVGSSKAREQVGDLMKAVMTEASSLEDAFKQAVRNCVQYLT